ncbi:hypothetical protein EI94DRAFT_1808825 [Lactarius quietus]|nr:hypothetical protein EI94DRAFT_1808825 [Lactarius quietus]
MDSQEEEEEEDSPDIPHSATAPNATALNTRATDAAAPNKMGQGTSNDALPEVDK